MAVDDYNENTNNHHSEMHHLRRDTREAHSDSQLAKWLSILALIAAVVALTVALFAINKAGDAQSTANRATESAESAKAE